MCYVCLFGISHLNTTMEHPNTGADPGFSKGGVCVCGGGVRTITRLHPTSFFHKKKYGQNICVCFALEGLTESPEPPLDPPQ